MRVVAKLTELANHIAVQMAAPSPLVGEGIAAGRHKLDRVRGSLRDVAMRRQPLTRRDTHCVRAAPPSPTGGEGKTSATQQWQSA